MGAFFIVLIIVFVIGFPAMILEEVFKVSFNKAFLWCFLAALAAVGGGIALLKWGKKQPEETQIRIKNRLMAAVASAIFTTFVGFAIIGVFVFDFIQDPQLGMIITSLLSIVLFFLIYNVGQHYFNEERGFIGGTKAWVKALPALPIIIILAFLSDFIPGSEYVVGILFLGWLIYFFVYPLFRGARSMDNIKRKHDLKKFANKYHDAVKEGTNLPAVPTRKIPQVTGIVSGWFSKLRAKDASEIAKAHSDISGYAVNTVRNETELIIELETREDKIALAKDTFKREPVRRDREDEIEQLELERKRMENQAIKERNDKKNQDLDSQLENYRRGKELEKGRRDINKEFEIDNLVEEAFKETTTKNAIKKAGNRLRAKAYEKHGNGKITDAQLEQELNDITEQEEYASDHL